MIFNFGCLWILQKEANNKNSAETITRLVNWKNINSQSFW